MFVNKDLRKMKRTELVEIIYALQQQVDKLETEKANLLENKKYRSSEQYNPSLYSENIYTKIVNAAQALIEAKKQTDIILDEILKINDTNKQ